ncbi:MAG TPA: site-specific integrase [Devosia sp.]|nr:site-specific integrase [Devosia sp.]
MLAVFARDVVPTYSRPKETASRIRRLLTWWSQPAHAMRTMTEMGRPVVRMTGHISDIKTATCQAYAEHVGAPRSASIDLELLRAAINHFAAEEQLPWKVHVWRPEKSLPRERWLTRSEVARLIWLAWRRRRSQDETEDEWAVWKHLARWMVMAHYTGTRKTAILKASFKRQLGFGYIDIESGLWYRLAEGTRPTKKRQPPARLPLPLIGHLRRWKKNGQTYVVEFHGKPIDRIDKAFRKLVSESELDGKIVPHTFRHTAITWGMQRGMDPWDASGYFGIDLKTLTEVYGHHHPDHLQEAAAAMARPGKVRAAK